MNFQDAIVGGVAIAVGVCLTAFGATGWSPAFASPKLRLLEASVGRVPARTALALIGLAVIALGILIALGFNWFEDGDFAS